MFTFSKFYRNKSSKFYTFTVHLFGNLHNFLSTLNLDMISEFENITKLDRETVCGLVESITVFEKDRITSPVTLEIRIEHGFIKNLPQNEKEDIA